MDSIDVKSAGYDAISNGYTIMTVAWELYLIIILKNINNN